MNFLENVGRREDQAQGEFSRFVEVKGRSLNGNEHNRLYRNLGGKTPRFADVAFHAGADRIEDGRGVVAVDVDQDGGLDLVVHSFGSRTVLLMNQGPRGNWIQLRLRGTKSNRDGIGARVVLEAGGLTQTRTVTSTAGYLTGRSLAVQFGLGEAMRVEKLVVHWPSGETTTLKGVSAGQRLLITEGETLGEDK
jgi:enediyne biosynthesis protein E4